MQPPLDIAMAPNLSSANALKNRSILPALYDPAAHAAKKALQQSRHRGIYTDVGLHLHTPSTTAAFHRTFWARPGQVHAHLRGTSQATDHHVTCGSSTSLLGSLHLAHLVLAGSRNPRAVLLTADISAAGSHHDDVTRQGGAAVIASQNAGFASVIGTASRRDNTRDFLPPAAYEALTQALKTARHTQAELTRIFVLIPAMSSGSNAASIGKKPSFARQFTSTVRLTGSVVDALTELRATPEGTVAVIGRGIGPSWTAMILKKDRP